MTKPNETRTRSLVKSASYRVLSILLTLVIVYLYIGNIVVSVEITVIGAVVSYIVYYAHERVWNLSAWMVE